MKYIQVYSGFHQVQCNTLADVERVARLVAKYGLLPANGITPNLEPAKDIGRLVREHLVDYSQDPEGRRLMRLLWEVPFSLVSATMADLIARFSFTCLNAQRNILLVGGLADFEFKDQRHYVEPFAQQLKELGLALYPMLQPMLGWIDEISSNETDTMKSWKLKLRTISWVNFFGPAYVEKYGRDFFLNLPGYKTQLLPDGGVFHQLSPTFVAPDRKQAKVLRQEVIAYCAEHGLKVTCRAPHSLPEVSTMTEATSREPADTADLQSYLDQILATTLALDDGTRVKPIYIPWEELSAAEEVVAVRRIQEAVLEEVRGRKGDRLRLEFNQIPEALEQALVELFGRDNPDVEWVEVE